jgi:hypothetical protein
MSKGEFTWGDYLSWYARAKAAEERVAELEKVLHEINHEVKVGRYDAPASVTYIESIVDEALSREAPE